MYESLVTGVLRGILDRSDRPLKVIEIGTAYGNHLPQLRGCKNLTEMVSIDPMYDWVPDLKPDETFDPSLVNDVKVQSWEENAVGLPIRLVTMKSHDAAVGIEIISGLYDVLLIDGCHHPIAAVEADYWDFLPHLTAEHTVIFDDINHGDPGIASERVESDLTERGFSVSREDVEGGRIRILRVSPPAEIPS